MIELTLAEVAAAVGAPAPRDLTDMSTTVTRVVTDSRVVQAGDCFVAIDGEHVDGHRFIDDALAAGASAVLSHAGPHDDPRVVTVPDTMEAVAALAAEVRRRVDPTVIAITGSVGKTSTKDLTRAAVGAGRRTVAAKGSFNNELGVPLTLLDVEDDTEVLVAELGSRGIGHIAALTPLVRPDIAIITAVAGVHLELFGDIDAVGVAKGELVEALDADGTAVLNADDPRVIAMAARTSARVLRVSAAGDPGADLRAVDVRLDSLGRASATAETPWGTTELRLPLAGRHHVGNALLALAVAGQLGVDVGAAAAALADAPISSWRGDVSVHGPADARVVVLNDAYNASPTSVRGALETLAAIETDGERVAVLGVMAEIGATHEAEHRGVGQAVAELGIDRLVVVGADASAIGVGAREAGMAAACVSSVDSADEAGMLLSTLDGIGAVLVKASRVAALERVASDLTARLDAAVDAADSAEDGAGAGGADR